MNVLSAAWTIARKDLQVEVRSRELDQSRAQRREESRLPRDARGIRGAGSRRQRLRRQHDEEHVREQRHRVDAVGKRADVGASRALGEPLRLQRVGGVADEDRDRRAGKDTAVDELRREAEDSAAQRVDQQQLNEIVDREAEEAVEVAADEPSHGAQHTADGC